MSAFEGYHLSLSRRSAKSLARAQEKARFQLCAVRVRMQCSPRPVRKTTRATIHPPSANKGSLLRATYKIADAITIRTASMSPVHLRMYPISAGSCLSSTRRVRRFLIASIITCECDTTSHANCRAVKRRVKKDNPTTSKPVVDGYARVASVRLQKYLNST